jgi:DNA-binding protein Fis
MSNHVTEKTLAVSRRNAAFALRICLIFMVAILLPAAAFCGPDRLVDSNEYKDKDFHKGIIKDYSDMVKGDRVDWVWVASAEKLGKYKVKVGSITNKSDSHSRSLVDSVKSIFSNYFADVAGNDGTLTAELCITEVQQYAPGKAWIPFAGGHQMQAGIGIEMILLDNKNRMVAKLRHFDRRGMDLKDAVEEVADHMVNYVSKH